MLVRPESDTSKWLISLAVPVPEYENSGLADAVGRRSGAEAVGSR